MLTQPPTQAQLIANVNRLEAAGVARRVGAFEVKESKKNRLRRIGAEVERDDAEDLARTMPEAFGR